MGSISIRCDRLPGALNPQPETLPNKEETPLKGFQEVYLDAKTPPRGRPSGGVGEGGRESESESVGEELESAGKGGKVRVPTSDELSV